MDEATSVERHGSNRKVRTGGETGRLQQLEGVGLGGRHRHNGLASGCGGPGIVGQREEKVHDAVVAGTAVLEHALVAVDSADRLVVELDRELFGDVDRAS